jgi:SAM-dependent methyltransferase
MLGGTSSARCSKRDVVGIVHRSFAADCGRLGGMGSWVPAGVDETRPNAARMYDYFLGGAHNFAVDRELAERLLAVAPEIGDIAQANRRFLHRAVRALVDAGIRQFLDIGSGIPSVGNVHEVARRRAADCRTVYVDIEPVAVAHATTMLTGDDHAAAVLGDLRDPAGILGSPTVRRLLDLDRPVAVLMVSMLHFIGDDEHPARLIGEYRRAVAPGSYLALSHVTANEHTDQVRALYGSTPTPLHTRTRAEVTALLDGFDLVDPGVVYLPQWRPDSPHDVGDHPERSSSYAAVGRLPVR